MYAAMKHNFSLNLKKTKEIIVDFRKTRGLHLSNSSMDLPLR